MATTILDAPALALDTVPTFTVSAGSNRRAYVLAINSHGSDAAPVTSMDLGGQTMSVVSTVDDTSFDVCMTLFELLETGITAMSGSTITPTGGTYNNRAFLYWSVQGATQGTVTPVTAATSGTSGSVSLARVADSWTLGVTVQDFAGTAFTGLADPAEAAENSVTNADIAYGYGTDTSRTASFTWTHSTSRNNVTLALNIAPAASGPTISSLGDSTPNYQGSTTITGTGFPTSQTGSAAAHLGGVSQTVTWNTTTSCSIASIARSTLAYGNYNLTVTDAAGNTSANYATSLSPQAGWKYITTSGTLADPSLRLTTTPVDIVSGNQISVGNVVGGTIDDITLYVDGSYSCAASVISFDYEVHDGTEWGAVGTEYPSTPAGRRGLIRSLARPLARSLVEALTN